jgi:hypothetical protein
MKYEASVEDLDRDSLLTVAVLLLWDLNRSGNSSGFGASKTFPWSTRDPSSRFFTAVFDRIHPEEGQKATVFFAREGSR